MNSNPVNSSTKDSGERQSCERCGKEHELADKCPAKWQHVTNVRNI